MKRKVAEPGSREERAVTLDKVEFRADEEAGTIEFRGHAAVFDQWTEIPSMFGGSFKESVARGSFRKLLAAGVDTRFLGLNHNPDLVMARTGPGTLKLKEDTKGLAVGADLDLRDPDVQRLHVKLERGDISQMSFGFRVGAHEIEEDEETGEVKRTITEFSALYDVSPVTFPAYEGTDAGLRACGVQLAPDGEVDEARLWALALEIFRGDKFATDEDRHVIDAAFRSTSRVSPWMAEQAVRAVAQEPDLQAALQGAGITATVDLRSTTEPPAGGRGMSTSAARAWLDVLAA